MTRIPVRRPYPMLITDLLSMLGFLAFGFGVTIIATFIVELRREGEDDD
jgi:hypothetical protein